jgi:iron complex outermembrane receptor protein
MARARWTAAAIAVAGAAANAQPLQEVTVTATPLGDTPLRSSQPVSVLRGEQLERRRSPSLGDTLDGLPGVHSSGFGTAASRPVIRGFSGPRVGITENGLDSLDVSSLSPDHAVVVDPLEARQLEVLRGPATLLYGSGAIGGLVNAVSDRIPTSPQPGLRGDALLGYDSASGEKLGGLRLRGGVQPGGRPTDSTASGRPAGGSLNWTLGAFDRDARDYSIPGNAVLGDPDSPSGRLPNSFAASRGLSGGLSWTDRWGAAGLSYSGIDSRYGIPSEEGVFIDLRNRRTEGLVELDAPVRGLETVRLRTADVRYRHQEIEGESGEIGTAFDSRGRDTRLDAVHQPLYGIRGALGLQSRQRDLSAAGDEAYVPSTRERENALYYVGQRPIGSGLLEFGFRQGRATRSPDAASGFEERRFDLTSFQLGGVVPIAGSVALAVTAGSAQRAPAVDELYANGTHAATGTFEIGNPSLAKERSRSLEIALQQASGPLRWKAGIYRQEFSNYVAGFSTDENGDGIADRVDEENTLANSVDDPTAGEYSRLVYQQAPATFTGFELEGAWQPDASPWTLRATLDRVRGTVEGFGDAPRMPPLRLGVVVDYAAGPWAGFVSVLRASSQDRAGAFETETPGYTRVDAEVAYGWSLGADRRATLFVQGRNLLNEDIRLSTSFVRDVVPMPGRSVYAGLRLRM